MKIFEQEKKDGIDSWLNNRTTIAFTTLAEPVDKLKLQIDNKIQKSLASYDDDDLYYVQSLLVSSSWNKNDDVFNSLEVWKARKTPEDKPTNLEHSENEIVGHMISNWTVDEQGNTIPDDIAEEDLPDKIHIITGSVIYKNFANMDLKLRAENLISEIEAGTKYVSMECYFDNFDYGLVDKTTGDYKILNRNEDTAYLTKHLRAYGGEGEVENYKIGRVLRNIKFSGKGYVDKPANPESIIFNKSNMDNLIENKKTDHLKNISVSSIQVPPQNGELSMSVEKHIEKIAEKVESMQECGEQLKEAYSKVSDLESQLVEVKANFESYTEENLAKQAELTEALASKNKELEDHKNKNKKDEEDMDEAKAAAIAEITKTHDEILKAKDAEIASLGEQIAQSNELIEQYKAKEAEIEQRNKTLSRINDLVESGISQSAAESAVEKFAHLDDESFSAVKNLFAENLTQNTEATTEIATEEADVQPEAAEASDVSEDTAYEDDSEVLETAEASTEIPLVVGGLDSDMQNTRASLVDFVCSRLNKSTK